MAAVFIKMLFAAVFVVAVALSGAGVSAENHHLVGGEKGWGPDLDVVSWLSGRVFRVGDKIWFKYSGTEDNIVELKSLEEFESCDLTNPIRMYTEPVNHVALEKEGVRYFTSGNLNNCKNGLKLPVPVHPSSEFGPPDEPYHPSPEFGPPDEPYHPFGPPDYPHSPPDEPEPVHPPQFEPPPPRPSGATRVNGLSFVVFVAGWLICYMGVI